jgi:hypothetical protein
MKKKTKLKDLQRDARYRFRARFRRLEDKQGYRVVDAAVVLEDVRLVSSGTQVLKQVCFTKSTLFDRLGRLELGDLVEFDARVTKVQLGYDGSDFLKRIEQPPRVEWRLTHPTKIRVVEPPKE